jgi:hypothetical protein
VNQLFGCKGCSGAYHDTQNDGSIYFHACPPLPPDKNGVQVEQPNKRDENLMRGIELVRSANGLQVNLTGEAAAAGRKGQQVGIRSEGAGVECLSDATLKEPAWITQMKAQMAKLEED